MSNQNVDRDILMIFLAHQNGFVTDEQLLSALEAWTANDKSEPLDATLRTLNILDPQISEFLNPLVDKHIEHHDNDVQQSLAAISSISTLRREIDKLEDEDLDRTLAAIPSRPPDLPAGSAGTASAVGGRFRILRPHDKGGLGVVSVARDQELNREVALKEIRSRIAFGEEQRARFVVEAEITGGLEHPGIVPVYGCGQYEDGRPFYAMKFIQGDSLKKCISDFHKTDTRWSSDRGRAELRKMLGRFIDVCYAIEYAHSRSVLHRDLKPGNIMIGKFGETLVVDWGLALVGAPNPMSEEVLMPASASGTSPDVEGHAIGTPHYMSPEQAEGRIKEFNPTTDVYALGATLYSILTGKAPISGTRKIDLILERVKTGDFPPPLQVRDDVPPALDAICRKAMSTQQRDRYQTARALAEDVEAYLADDSVSAWDEPWAVKAGRWMRKHPAIVSSVFAALLVGIVTASIGYVAVNAQRQRAIAAEQDARAAVNSFFDTVANETLLGQPGVQQVRKRLLEKARAYHQDFATKFDDAIASERDLAQAYFNIGKIDALLQDDEATALESFDKASAIYADLIEKRPHDAALRGELGKAWNEIGSLYHNAGQLVKARVFYNKALAERKSVTESYDVSAPADPELEIEADRLLANIHMNLGQLSIAQKAAEALAELNAASKIRDAIDRDSIGNDTLRFALVRDTGKGDYNMGRYHVEVVGDNAKAQPNFESAIRTFEDADKLAATLSPTPEHQVDTIELLRLRAVANRMLGDALSNFAASPETDQNAKIGVLQNAIGVYQTALPLAQKLASENPQVAQYAEELAGVHKNLALARLRLAAQSNATERSDLARQAFMDFNRAKRIAENWSTAGAMEVRRIAETGSFAASNMSMAELRKTATANRHQSLALMTEDYADNIAERLTSDRLTLESPNVAEVHNCLARLLELDPKKQSPETVVAFWKCKWMFERFDQLASRASNEDLAARAQEYLGLIAKYSEADN